MQNVYDLAHELARSLKETDQYKDYARLRQQLKANESVDKMIADFQQKSLSIQAKQMVGEEPDEEAVKQLQSLYAIMISDPLAANYMNAEMAFSQIVSELYQIIGEAAKID